ncbi:hypothetical protein EDB80DRAFT_716926 [Ilyonectria destructans]|nr:hypothetical protein EDB80DRAFT_716926 [Ilyonectria destructans]
MAQANWDPGNLLQITSNGDIRCIGQTLEGYRCSLSASDRDAARIYRLLGFMSSIHPTNTRQMPLDQLASLCLCGTHSGKAKSIADDWKKAIEAANWHHHILSGAASAWGSPPGNNSVRQLQTTSDPRVIAEVTCLATQLVASHQHKAELRGLENELKKLRAAATYWKEDFERSQATNRTQVLKLKESNRALEDGINKSSKALDATGRETTALRVELNEAIDGLRAVCAELDRARNENELLRPTITKLQEEKASLSESVKKRCIEADAAKERGRQPQVEVEEKASLSESLRKLRIEADAAKERERQLVAELEAKESYLHQCRVQIGDERSRNAVLESLVKNFQNMEIKMKKSISECWLHRFWGWIARVRASLQWQSSPLATNVWQRAEGVQLTSQFGVGLGSFLWKKPLFWYPIQQTMLYY